MYLSMLFYFYFIVSNLFTIQMIITLVDSQSMQGSETNIKLYAMLPKILSWTWSVHAGVGHQYSQGPKNPTGPKNAPKITEES